MGDLGVIKMETASNWEVIRVVSYGVVLDD